MRVHDLRVFNRIRRAGIPKDGAVNLYLRSFHLLILDIENKNEEKKAQRYRLLETENRYFSIYYPLAGFYIRITPLKAYRVSFMSVLVN